MRRVMNLREEEVGRFPRAMLSDVEVLALNSCQKFEVEPASVFNGYTYGLRSRGWIGQIPIGDDLLIRISPKVPVANLFRMLEVAYNLHSFRLFDGETQIESVEDVYERIVSVLARRVLDRARKGLYRSYIHEGDELPYVRGRIDVVGTALNGTRGIPRIPCAYEEHTADLQDNRILAWTLHQVRRQGLRREKVRIELDRARRSLAGTITLKQCSPRDCLNRLYHRLNDDYAPMHGLCRFILDQSGPGIEHGDQTFIPFDLNMPQLFESFVAEWLRSNPPSGTTVRCQHHAQLDANLQMRIHVDIVICEERLQRPIAVLDTKYKADEQPSDKDIYQIAFYARELVVDRAMLVYPSKLASPLRMLHGKGILIESLVFDVGVLPAVAGNAFLEALNARLASIAGLASQKLD
jgi:5-methylcytosine-specific restriction enzyme subunit McrC